MHKVGRFSCVRYSEDLLPFYWLEVQEVNISFRTLRIVGWTSSLTVCVCVWRLEFLSACSCVMSTHALSHADCFLVSVHVRVLGNDKTG